MAKQSNTAVCKVRENSIVLYSYWLVLAILEGALERTTNIQSET